MALFHHILNKHSMCTACIDFVEIFNSIKCTRHQMKPLKTNIYPIFTDAEYRFNISWLAFFFVAAVEQKKPHG